MLNYDEMIMMSFIIDRQP